MDESNAKNCNYGSDNSGHTDDDDAGDGDSSDSDEGNEAHGCAGRRGSLTTVGGGAKPGSPIHNRLRARKPLLNLASGSNSNKAILGAVLNANLEEWLI